MLQQQVSFNPRREADPLSTQLRWLAGTPTMLVSIPGGKPILFRRLPAGVALCPYASVSIPDGKPILFRRRKLGYSDI
jgi:hypothetical protein